MMSKYFPEAFLKRFHEIVPDERTAQVIENMAQKRSTSFRINTLPAEVRPTLAALVEEGFPLTTLEWLSGIYAVPPEQRRALTESLQFQSGRIYIQHPASMLPPQLLAPQADDRLLDLAAAPAARLCKWER